MISTGHGYPLYDMITFYRNYADVYEAIASDRDFESEVDQLIALVQPSVPKARMRVAELFAGPAYHGRVFAARGAEVLCFESEPKMIELAERSSTGSKLDFVKGILPSSLETAADASFDLMIAMRFSLGYLAPPELAGLLRELGRVLVPGGFFVAELHDPDQLRAGLPDLSIRTREARLSSGCRVRCVWPAGAVRWSADRSKVAMEVSVHFLDSSDNRGEVAVFVNEEYVYSLPELQRLVGGCRELRTVSEPPGWGAEAVLAVVQRRRVLG